MTAHLAFSNPAGVLGQALADASPDLMRHLHGTVINSLLSAEVHVVYGGFDQEPADVAVSGTGDLARTLLAPECSEGSVRGGRGCRCGRIGPHPSPISTASANPARVEIPRRYPSLCAIRVHPESAASCSIRASSRSRRAEVAST